MRIASMIASGTELVCELGLGESLVARSHECDHPPWVARLPVVSRPTFPIDGTSRDIDTLVRERLRTGAPLYEVDEALLRAARPDVILTQTHCEVCAIGPGDVERDAPELCRKQVVALSAGTLAGIRSGFVDVARVLGAEDAAAALLARIDTRLAAASAAIAGTARPTLVCIEWIEPLFTMSNWGAEITARAGGQLLLGEVGARSTTLTWDAVRAADPDVLVIAPCGFKLARTLEEIALLEAQPGWASLRAVRAGRVFAADGNRFFHRSGPSVFETVELLAELLHPDRVPPAHAAEYRRV